MPTVPSRQGRLQLSLFTTPTRLPIRAEMARYSRAAVASGAAASSRAVGDSP